MVWRRRVLWIKFRLPLFDLRPLIGFDPRAQWQSSGRQPNDIVGKLGKILNVVGPNRVLARCELRDTALTFASEVLEDNPDALLPGNTLRLGVSRRALAADTSTHVRLEVDFEWLNPLPVDLDRLVHRVLATSATLGAGSEAEDYYELRELGRILSATYGTETARHVLRRGFADSEFANGFEWSPVIRAAHPQVFITALRGDFTEIIGLPAERDILAQIAPGFNIDAVELEVDGVTHLVWLFEISINDAETERYIERVVSFVCQLDEFWHLTNHVMDLGFDIAGLGEAVVSRAATGINLEAGFEDRAQRAQRNGGLFFAGNLRNAYVGAVSRAGKERQEFFDRLRLERPKRRRVGGKIGESVGVEGAAANAPTNIWMFHNGSYEMNKDQRIEVGGQGNVVVTGSAGAKVNMGDVIVQSAVSKVEGSAAADDVKAAVRDLGALVAALRENVSDGTYKVALNDFKALAEECAAEEPETSSVKAFAERILDTVGKVADLGVKAAPLVGTILGAFGLE